MRLAILNSLACLTPHGVVRGVQRDRDPREQPVEALREVVVAGARERLHEREPVHVRASCGGTSTPSGFNSARGGSPTTARSRRR